MLSKSCIRRFVVLALGLPAIAYLVSCYLPPFELLAPPESTGNMVVIKQPSRCIDCPVDLGTLYSYNGMIMGSGADGALYSWSWTEPTESVEKISLDTESWRPFWEQKMRGWDPRLNEVYAILQPNRLVYPVHTQENTELTVFDITDRREITRLPLEREWSCTRLRSSGNAAFAAVYLDSGGLTPEVEGVNRLKGNKGYRFGVLQNAGTEATWLPTMFRSPDSSPIVSDVAVSNDGTYLAAVGVCNAGWIMLFDVPRKQTIWERTPQGSDVPYGDWTVNFNDVCFSPDGKRIYVGANIGLLCFDRVGGKITKQWPIPARVTSVAVSPDEMLVAGGTGGAGKVYVCRTDDPDPLSNPPLMRIDTQQHNVYCLAFSADGSHLATEGVISTGIKIWKMPSLERAASDARTSTLSQSRDSAGN